MKKFLLLLTIISTMSLSGQTNDHLLNSRWINGYYELEQWGPTFKLFLKRTTKYCTTNRDTLIGGISYVQLFDCGQQPYVYRGAIRIDSTRWYFHSRDSTKEMLLYDFGLEVGDTLHEKFYYETYTGTGWDDLVLLQIDTIIHHGSLFRKFTFDQAGAWIEGVGNVQGLLWDPYINISGYGLSLECYSKDDTTLYYNGEYSPNQLNESCQLSFSLDENAPLQISVFPNPVRDNFSLLIPAFNGLMELKIYNLAGETVFKQSIQSRETSIEPGLASGNYIIRLTNENGEEIFTQKLIIEADRS